MKKYKNIIIIFTILLSGAIVINFMKLYRITRLLVVNQPKFTSEIFKLYNITSILIAILTVSFLLQLYTENKKSNR